MIITRQIKPLIFSLALSAMLVLAGCTTDETDENEGDFQYQVQLKGFNSCDELTAYLQDTASLERRLMTYYNDELFPDRIFSVDLQVDEVSNSPGTVAVAESADTIGDSTSTNNQVIGVDEADFIKTDAEYSYIVSGGYFLIFDNWPAAQSNELSRIEIKGNPSNLFIYEDVVWIVSNIYDYDILQPLSDSLVSFAPRVNRLTYVSLFDVSDRSNPELIRETTLEGYYVDARRVANRVHMVSAAHIDIYPILQDQEQAELDINALLPAFTDKLHGDGEPTSTTSLISDCGNIYRPGTANGTATVSLFSFDLENPQTEIKRQTIISNSGTIYANQQHLYMASVENNHWAWLPVLESDEETPIPGTTFHKFSLDDEPLYLASGRVDGHLINQFAMDEHNDLLRTVTTVSAWWADGVPVNSLYVLQQQGNQLVQRSMLTDLGKIGERIYAARFMGDKGFLVTFERIDPLYTLDLSDPDDPRVAGELEVPGFSTYLHPIEDNLLLAVGRSNGNNSVDLSLFDISDFDNPSLLFRESVGDGSYSEAEYNHKAFTWFAQQQLLALPVSQWRRVNSLDGFASYDMFNGLKLYHVDKQMGFDHVGDVDHSNFYHDDINNSWFYPDSIRRSFFISDTELNSYLYSISSRGIKVNAVNDLETDLATLPLPVYEWDNLVMSPSVMF